MNTLMRNMVLMCFSAFVLHTAILAHADAGYFADNLQKIKEYIASDTLHYYIKDYQGNVRCVVRYDGAVAESNEYYPYGGLFAATASVQPNKYGAKELDRTHGLDLYDSEARWYDSLLGRTTTIDPKAEKYYNLSPYTWCAGNPVRFLDPDGMILWQVNCNGEVVGCDQLAGEDIIQIVGEDKQILSDNNGNELSITFKSGTIIRQRHITDEGDGLDIWEVRGDSNGSSLFEFFSNNITKESQVEFSLFQTGIEGDKGLNFITTSHDVGKEAAMRHLYKNQLITYTIRTFTHSHPNGSEPSKNDRRNALRFDYNSKLMDFE